ncbi:hypothetical protein [uncultured Spirosoma sp.]|uniref:hypothetical protein n=1 Tax=uncultured Spirosoma sp. TaxID=278208 RepID=UPI00258E0EB5|nr:hypothetical protein [uncultured Spirosoma sp.]
MCRYADRENVAKRTLFQVFLAFLLLAIFLRICQGKWFICKVYVFDFHLLVLMKLGVDVVDKYSEYLLNNTKSKDYLKKTNLLSMSEYKQGQMSTGSLDKTNLYLNEEGKYGNIRFANISYSNPLHVEKINAVKLILESTEAITHFLRDKNALIKLKDDKNNLATVVVAGGQVQVTLSPWFFETQSVGKIVGIIAHELAVHPLASEKLTELQRETEKINTGVNVRKKIDLTNDVIFYDGKNNADHLFAATGGNPRYEIYQQTVYEMAVAMLRNVNKSSCINERNISDLIFSYFSDTATILATNDHKDKAVEKLEKIAISFNWLRKEWLIFLVGKEEETLLRKLTPQKQCGERTSPLGDFVSSVTLRFKQK